MFIDNTRLKDLIAPYDHSMGWSWTYPVTCGGNTHVFACEHADKCQCGKAVRVPDPKKCGACGK